MTGCNYPNWNLARTHLLFAKRAVGVSTSSGLSVQWGIRACSPTAPPNRAQGKRGRSGEQTFSDPPLLPSPSRPPPGSNSSPVIRNFSFKMAWLCVLQSAFCWVLSVSVCLFVCLPACFLPACLSLCLGFCMRLSPGPGVSLLL